MSSSISEMLRIAMEHHRAGRLPQADALYRQILDEDPSHAGALHAAGVMAGQCRRHDGAVELIRRAIAIEPANPHYHISLGNAFQALGQSVGAIASFQQALALNPGLAEVHSNLGLAFHAAGRLDDAIASHRRALALKPDYAEAHNNLGNALRAARRLDDAIASYQLALALKPTYANAHSNLGNALLDIGRTDDAIACQQRALALRPDFAEAHSNMGNALRGKGQFDEAIASHQRALALKPNLAETQSNLGAALHDVGRFDEAVVHCRLALQLRPNYVQAYVNLGTALDSAGRFDEAIAAFRQAVALDSNLAEAHSSLAVALYHNGQLEDASASCRRAIALAPTRAEAHNNLGPILYQQRRVDEAIASYHRALEIEPNHAQAHFNLSLALLLRGDYSAGWAEHEWRSRVKKVSSPRRDMARPQWTGDPLGERTVFLHYEWGFGDTLQWVRYLDLVARTGGRIIAECQAPLRRLLRNCFGQHQWIVDGEPLPPFDVHCPFASMPHVFRTTVDSIPGTTPYLNADESDVTKWRTRMEIAPGTFKVGLAWAGNKAHLNDRNRSMFLPKLAPLADVPNVSFYSLQKGEESKQANNPPPGMQLIDWTSELRDFADTAALIANLDLVITVDTAVAHLAGAMGRPVWTMVPFAPDWRWLLDRDDSPWYPTARLFRQPAMGDWRSVADEVALALRALSDVARPKTYY